MSLCTATTKEQHDRAQRRIDTTKHHEGAHKTAPQRSNTTEHHEGASQEELETRPSQDKYQPEGTTRVRQSSKPAGEKRTELKVGQVNLYSPNAWRGGSHDIT